jgi:hypothetical protein
MAGLLIQYPMVLLALPVLIGLTVGRPSRAQGLGHAGVPPQTAG